MKKLFLFGLAAGTLNVAGVSLSEEGIYPSVEISYEL